MSGPNDTSRPRVVVVGAGVAALEFVLALAELAPDRADVELIAPGRVFTYRPWAVAEAFDAGPPRYRIDLDRVAAHAGARRFDSSVVSVDVEQRVAFTTTGEPFPYDILLVATGARLEEGLPGALTFAGGGEESEFRTLLAGLEDGSVSSVAFVVPNGVSWTLPLYELALLSATRLEERGRPGSRVLLVTPEPRPLGTFGGEASDAVAKLLDAAGVELRVGAHAAEVVDEGLRLVPDGMLTVERVVTLPRLRGPHLVGLPSNRDGFVPTDLHGLVRRTENVYAAGDTTTFPVKHGGIAVDQAAAAAEAVAARLGTSLRPHEFRPVLRGLLLTGQAPRFLWSDLAGGRGDTSVAATQPLWWPPGKVAGGRLARYLHAEGMAVPPPPAGPATTPQLDSSNPFARA